MTGVSAFLFFSQAHNHHNQGRHNHYATIIHTHGRRDADAIPDGRIWNL